MITEVVAAGGVAPTMDGESNARSPRTHEREAADIARKLYPDLFVSQSSEMSGGVGESRRWMTAVLNSFVQRDAAVYLESVSTKLQESGLAGSLAFFQGLGGGISKERALEFPLALLGSGPAGGAIGPGLGGVLLEFFWWGSVFLIGVPVMGLLLVLGPRTLPEYRARYTTYKSDPLLQAAHRAAPWARTAPPRPMMPPRARFGWFGWFGR